MAPFQAKPVEQARGHPSVIILICTTCTTRRIQYLRMAFNLFLPPSNFFDFSTRLMRYWSDIEKNVDAWRVYVALPAPPPPPPSRFETRSGFIPIDFPIDAVFRRDLFCRSDYVIINMFTHPTSLEAAAAFPPTGNVPGAALFTRLFYASRNASHFFDDD